MKGRGRLVAGSLVLLLASVLLGGPAGAAVHFRSDTLLPVRFGLPFAKSGQPYSYSVAAAATGGTKPYRCTPQVLHVGSLKLGSNCKITGIAPVIRIKSVTGPFVFKLTDSANPPKTVTLYPLDITTVAEQPTFSGKWAGTYSVTYSQIAHCANAITIHGPMTLSLTQTGTSLSGTGTFIGSSVGWTGSCAMGSRSNQTLPFTATLTGMRAVNAHGLHLTLNADLRSLTGSEQASGVSLTFTVHRTSGP